MIRGRRDRRRQAAVLGVVAMLAAAVSLPPSAVASADSQPPILADYNLDWIERVEESAWPLPREQRPVICLLDTGVAVTPDTPADNPAGPIVARLDVDGRGGEPQGDSRLHVHGTQMASIIAAPRNDWGTVGILPQARIVSVRVTIGADVFATPASVRRGVETCLSWSRTKDVAVAAVVMAESRYDERVSDVEQWKRAAERARLFGGVFIGAVGNHQDAAAVAPVAAGGVLAVSAADPGGQLCSFAPSVPQRTLLGPGCDGRRAGWIPGSSAATAAVGALAAALAMRDASVVAPSRETGSGGPARVDSLVRALWGSAQATPAGERRLDGARIRSDSFDAFVRNPGVEPSDRGPQGADPHPVPLGPVLPLASGPRLRVERPGIMATWRRGKLTVQRLTHRRTGRFVVEVAVRKKLLTLRTRSERVQLRVRKPPARVRAWVESSSPGAWVTLTRRAAVIRR